MNFIVFDLEFNQAWKTAEDKSLSNPKCPFEIIQIGAIKLDENLKTISTFERLVKPEVYRSIHPFIGQMTGIKAEDLANADSFVEVYSDFTELMDKDSVLCIWGMADMKELLRNAQYHKFDISLIPEEFINVQRYASKLLHCNKGSNVGLRTAVEMMNIPINRVFHDAFSDAHYTVEVFKYIYNENIKTTKYQQEYENKTRQVHKKTMLDSDKLIKQFEKMYDREMSEEEKSIIKLAYLMGKTNQFQVDQ